MMSSTGFLILSAGGVDGERSRQLARAAGKRAPRPEGGGGDGRARTAGLRRQMNDELNFPPNFERRVISAVSTPIFASKYSLESS